MGAWGAGIYDNDDASDFAAEIVEGSDLTQIEEALDQVLDSTDYLEAPDASVGLVAADVVACLVGQSGPRSSYTAKVDEWVSRVKLTPSSLLREKASRTATRVVTEPSELLDLWSESGESAEFRAAVTDLISRLQTR